MLRHIPSANPPKWGEGCSWGFFSSVCCQKKTTCHVCKVISGIYLKGLKAVKSCRADKLCASPSSDYVMTLQLTTCKREHSQSVRHRLQATCILLNFCWGFHKDSSLSDSKWELLGWYRVDSQFRAMRLVHKYIHSSLVYDVTLGRLQQNGRVVLYWHTVKMGLFEAIHVVLLSYLRIYLGIPATISDSIPQWSDPRRNLKNPEDQKQTSSHKLKKE